MTFFFFCWFLAEWMQSGHVAALLRSEMEVLWMPHVLLPSAGHSEELLHRLTSSCETQSVQELSPDHLNCVIVKK